MPPALEHDADKRYFAEALDHVAAVVHGRRSQEIQPKSPNRRRLVLTHGVEALARHPDNSNALLWNPAGAPFEEACAALGVASGTIGIIGGPKVYSLFLKMGYDAFHLCRAVERPAARRAAGLRPGPLSGRAGSEPRGGGVGSRAPAEAQRRGQPRGLEAYRIARSPADSDSRPPFL